MSPRYFDWSQEHGTDKSVRQLQLYLEMMLQAELEWDLRKGKQIEGWNPHTPALFDDDVEPTDFPITSNDIPVYSPSLIRVMQREGVGGIQLLPLRVRHRQGNREIPGYHVANYLKVIDCLNREHSKFQIWTKENLLFWEKRPWMLGKFRDVQRAALDANRIGQTRLFRLWGWEAMVIVREDVKQAIEDAGITGCRFTEVELAQ